MITECPLRSRPHRTREMLSEGWGAMSARDDDAEVVLFHGKRSEWGQTRNLPKEIERISAYCFCLLFIVVVV